MPYVVLRWRIGTSTQGREFHCGPCGWDNGARVAGQAGVGPNLSIRRVRSACSFAMKALRFVFALLALGVGTSQFAGTISYNAAVDGLVAPVGTSFTTFGGALFVEQFGDPAITFLGVDHEISLEQSLTISFLTPQVFEFLTLGMLFDGPEYGDLNEQAGAFVNGSGVPFVLTATGATTAQWSLLASTIVNESPATESGAGVWRIVNPFGNLPITSLTLTPLSSNPTGNESDFGLVAFQSRQVPESASSALLLTLGLGGLAAIAVRRGVLVRGRK